MVVTDERLQVRRLLIFFCRIFLKMSSKKNVFSGEEVVTLKLYSFLAGSFSRNRAVLESDGLVRRFFFFFQYSDVDEEIRCFSKSVLILEDIRRTKLMSIFRCVKVAPKSSLFL